MYAFAALRLPPIGARDKDVETLALRHQITAPHRHRDLTRQRHARIRRPNRPRRRPSTVRSIRAHILRLVRENPAWGYRQAHHARYQGRAVHGVPSKHGFRTVAGVLLRDQNGGGNHRRVLLSLVYRLVRCLFGLLTVLVRADLSKDVELLVLRHENQVLRRQLGGRPRWGHLDRLWLAALSRLVRHRQWADVFPITSATILR
jgi:hypothetical protein